MKRKIRTSTAIVSGLVLFLILLILGGIMLIRIMAGRDSSPRDLSGSPLGDMEGETITLALDKDIRELTLSGVWDCEILQSGTPEMTITLSGSARPSDVRWETKGNRLLLNYTGKIQGDNDAPRVVIRLPELAALDSTATANISFTGFDQEDLHISAAGLVNVTGKDSRFSRLRLSLSGAGAVDLAQSSVENAEINLSGAGSIRLHMDGGDLEGNLSGLGSIEYSGSIRHNRIRETGLGSVEQVY